jgi:CHAD domain-containing protein
MKKYAQAQAAILLRRVAFQAGRTLRGPDADAVHDLRVAIRRLSTCLRTFEVFFPERAARKIRRQLTDVMDLAGAVRDRDIALELLREAGVAEPAAQWHAERITAERALRHALRAFQDDGGSRRWRRRLEL